MPAVRHRLFTSESVTEGHPDKVADQISDAVLDAVLSKDPLGRVACETALSTGTVLVFGEITTEAYVDIAGLVRQTIKEIGYTRAKYGIDWETCGVLVGIDEQSPDISQGVNHGGAGDQGMMFGFACDETPELMPAPIQMAHQLARQLAVLRRDGTLRWARPDGKTQVTIEYDGDGRPRRVDTVLVSVQHGEEVTQEQIFEDVQHHVVGKVIPAEWLDADTKRYVNPTGRFVIGGPDGGRGAHRSQDHRRHLWRIRPPRRRRVQREGSVEGRSQRSLRGAVGGQERRRGRARDQMRDPGRLRDRRCQACLGTRRDLRDREGPDRHDRVTHR